MTDFISFIHANAFYIRVFFLAADVIMFLLYGSDKRKAAKGRWNRCCRFARECRQQYFYGYEKNAHGALFSVSLLLLTPCRSS